MTIPAPKRAEALDDTPRMAKSTAPSRCSKVGVTQTKGMITAESTLHDHKRRKDDRF